ncbi:unnamed protein product (macronuclear) [Paramecium tetraurelia]|uniref:Uncharacterized protein n=1 Tax=Paramecium tetraurelia TaxID=5888 RepID=A0BH09_PARTE|nr:uncharacterized protein GSPATT00028861001 [Paramecium tetraurelia]CAK57826.1 unnamed protein product [Paramecium tetraurelia]|eukprot:XP_001425224.1 hypothetical protein (macronuclear) [Paramecium tetraurelia strain d4-2]
MFNFLSINYKQDDFVKGFQKESQTINTGLWIEHYKIKSGKDFSLIALQQINNQDLEIGLYKITSHFDLDKKIYQKFCKYEGKYQYCKISKKLEDFFLIINSNSSLIHFNIPNNEEIEIKARQDYLFEGLKLANNQSIMILLSRSKVKKDIQIELRSIQNSKVLLQVYSLCSDWNLERLSLQKIDLNNMISVTMEQHLIQDYVIFIKHIINKKIVKTQIINTFNNHFVDSKIYTLQGVDCMFSFNSYSKVFKLQIMKHQKILRQLNMRLCEFYHVVDKRMIVLCEKVGLSRFRIFRYDIRTGNQFDFCQNDDVISNIQKLKLEMNKLSLCKYIWQPKNQVQDSMINLQKN